MNAKNSYIVFGLFLIGIIFVGCLEKQAGEKIEPAFKPSILPTVGESSSTATPTPALSPTPDFPKYSLPGLCAGSSECDRYCHAYSYECETYCIAHPENEMCKERFSFVYKEEYVPLSIVKGNATPAASPIVITPASTPTTESPTPIQEETPSIQHIGIELNAYDPSTGKAGDFVFTQNKIFHDKIFQDYGEYITETPDGKPKYNPQPAYIVSLGTKVRSLTNGTVVEVKKIYSGDYSIHVAKDLSSPWRYETEHVINPLVKQGDSVVAGQVMAEASPHNSQNNAGFGLFEIGILKGGNPPSHVCPYAYLEESIKAQTLEKIRALYKSWEDYKGNSALYDETAYQVPGCLTFEEIEG